MNSAVKTVLSSRKLALCGLFVQNKMISLQQYKYQQMQESDLLSEDFSLKLLWKERIQHLKNQGLTGSYEWITMVQKKYSGGSFASAVDLDVAVMLSKESDQIKDLIELVYRLRHTKNAGNLLPSTEYAFFRLLIKHDEWDKIFTILNDPINYGLFMNEHLSCYAMDRLLCSGNIQGAAKIATIAMQQEMFDFNFLNFMAAYTLLKWNELPSDKRLFSTEVHVVPQPDEEINEEEVKTMKFPYLKNEWNDGHFDLFDANALVGKSIEWFSRKLSDDPHLQQKLGAPFKSLCRNLISFGSNLQKLPSTCEKTNKEAVKDTNSEKENLNNKLEKGNAPQEDSLETSVKNPTAKMIYEMFASIMTEEEQKLIHFQKKQFLEWNDSRLKFIEVQAERLDLRLRLDEIKAEQKSINDRHKVLFFFENRIKYEEEAREKDKLLKGLGKSTKSKKERDLDYSTNLFETQRRIAEKNITPTYRK